MKLLSLIFSITFLLVFQAALAQEQDLKPKDQQAEFILESQFYPRINTGVFEPNIKARIVFSSTHVLRSNLTFLYNNDKREILEFNGNGVGSVETLNQQYQLSIGYEYLFIKERLTPYLGFELITGWGKEEVYGSRTDSILFVSDLNYTSKVPVTQIGLSVFSGFDFIIVDDLYIGTEIGLQYLSTKYARGEFHTMDASSSTSADITTLIPENQKKSLGVSGLGVIRIGWKF